MLKKVLIPNRGEIAVRIVRACFDEGIHSVLACSSEDVASLPARLADDVVCIGPAAAAQSYLSIPAVITAALATGCDAIHPGYGFLSERAALADACAAHGLTFVGPSADTIRRGGDKLAARELAASLGIPVGEGTGMMGSISEAAEFADGVGYPLLLKAAAGGGGRGMLLAHSEDDLRALYATASQEALQAFGDGRVYLERFIADARHVEVQILADRHGNTVHLADRDCSVQRRYQKLVEEAPAVAVPERLRGELAQAAVTLGKALDYESAGTMEFLVDQQRDTFMFLEVNTRVQVEHPVTEAITGIDIVREQLRIAGGQPLSFTQHDVHFRGHAIECRINAESVAGGFIPTPGRVDEWVVPQGDGIRVDTHCYPGYVIPPYYDSMVAKLIVHAADRSAAIERLSRALDRFRVSGIGTTVPFHRALCDDAAFRAGQVNTKWVENEFLPALEQRCP